MIFQSKSNKPGGEESPEARATRIQRIVAAAKAAGERIPGDIRLIGTREPSEAEKVYGASLEINGIGHSAGGRRPSASSQEQ